MLGIKKTRKLCQHSLMFWSSGVYCFIELPKCQHWGNIPMLKQGNFTIFVFKFGAICSYPLFISLQHFWKNIWQYFPSYLTVSYHENVNCTIEHLKLVKLVAFGLDFYYILESWDFQELLNISWKPDLTTGKMQEHWWCKNTHSNNQTLFTN